MVKIILERITKVELTVEQIIWQKRPKYAKKHVLFVKNVCFDTRFGQLSGIQQFLLS